MLSKQSNQPRILIFDIESSSLTADSGVCICVGYKWLGDAKVECPTIKTFVYGNDPAIADRSLMKFIHGILAQADVWVTYNGIRFDIPFINTRCLLAGLKPLPPVPHVDVYYTAKSKLRLNSNKLVNVEKVLNTNENKTSIDFKHWTRALGNHGKLSEQSMKYIVDHCKKDVLVLEEVYLKLRPLMLRHPRVGSPEACHACGGFHLQRRGFQLVKTPLVYKKQKYQCMDCGAWSTRKTTPEERS